MAILRPTNTCMKRSGLVIRISRQQSTKQFVIYDSQQCNGTVLAIGARKHKL